MITLKKTRSWLKKNGLLDTEIIISSALAISAHFIAIYPWNNDSSKILYSTIPDIDILTHFLGGYAVSAIAGKLHQPLSKRYKTIKNIPTGSFAIGATILLGSLNEIAERLATPLTGNSIFFETTTNSIKDMFVNIIGAMTQRYIIKIKTTSKFKDKKQHHIHDKNLRNRRRTGPDKTHRKKD